MTGPVDARDTNLRIPEVPGRSPAPRRAMHPAVIALAAAAGAVAFLADAHPTVHPVADAVYRIGFAVVVTLAASRARRWTWLVLADAVLIGARTPVALVCGSVAATITIACLVLGRRDRWMGASVGAVASVGLLHLGSWGPFGLTALIGVVGVVPLLLSARRNLRRSVRRPVTWAASVLAGLGLVAAAGLGVAALVGGTAASDGLVEARAGVAAAKVGDDGGAARHLDEAATSFSDADGAFSAWYTKPSELVPLLSYQSGALAQMSSLGRDLAVTADDTVTRANYRGVGIGDGRVDVEKVRTLDRSLQDVVDALRSARSRADAIATEWMAPPIRSRYDELIVEIDEAQADADTASRVVKVAPALLGGDGTRTYFVMFTTLSEARASGGFMGSWAELTIDDGRPHLSRVGRSWDLAVPPDRPPLRIDAPEDYLARYLPQRPDQSPGDVTVSPDFPSVAQAIASIYAQSPGGKQVDGVLSMDPYALAAMLRITGPIEVAGFEGELNADNAADILLKRQYVEFGVQEERVDFLHDAANQTFEAFLDQRSLKPQELTDALGPAVAERRLTAFSFVPDEQRVIEELGLSGTFPKPEGHDLFALVTQNSSNNKIDAFLRREVAYQAAYDPDTGTVAATATITLRNDAPSTGLPRFVIGNRKSIKQPDGVNYLWFSFYSPLDLIRATSDGRDLDVQYQRELGVNVIGGRIAIPAGGSVVLELSLTGTVRPGSTYDVTWYQQSTVNPDAVAVTVRPLGGWRPDPASGAPIDQAEVTGSWPERRTDGSMSVPLTR